MHYLGSFAHWVTSLFDDECIVRLLIDPRGLQPSLGLVSLGYLEYYRVINHAYSESLYPLLPKFIQLGLVSCILAKFIRILYLRVLLSSRPKSLLMHLGVSAYPLLTKFGLPYSQ